MFGAFSNIWIGPRGVQFWVCFWSGVDLSDIFGFTLRPYFFTYFFLSHRHYEYIIGALCNWSLIWSSRWIGGWSDGRKVSAQQVFTMGLFPALGYFHTLDAANGTVLVSPAAEIIEYVVLCVAIIKAFLSFFYLLIERRNVSHLFKNWKKKRNLKHHS